MGYPNGRFRPVAPPSVYAIAATLHNKMIIKQRPVWTPCCRRLALRSTLATLHTDGELGACSRILGQQLKAHSTCPYCGTQVDLDELVYVRHRFGERMGRMIFAGIPRLTTG